MYFNYVHRNVALQLQPQQPQMRHASLTLKTRFQNFLLEAGSNLQATSLSSKVTLAGSCFNELPRNLV